jgi:hypothetical protein
MVSRVEPGVEHEHIHSDVLDQFPYAEILFSACPIAIIRSMLVDLPQPEGGVENQTK